jgi:hypothetical protein
MYTSFTLKHSLLSSCCDFRRFKFYSCIFADNVSSRDKLVEVKKKPEIYTASDEKVKAFQSPALISKVKLAYRLKSHLGVTFRTKHYVNMNMEQ